MLCQGLAPGEARRLDVADVRLVAGELSVHGRGGRSRGRRVRLTKTVAAILEAHLAERPATASQALFLGEGGCGRLSARHLRTLARQWAARAGLPASTRAFDLRHAFTRESLDQGADPEDLRDALGLTTMDALFRCARRAATPDPARRARATSPARSLRRWVLEVLERQLEAWRLRGLSRVPSGFRWPPLPAEDLARIRAAGGDLTRLIDVILDELLP